MAFFNNCPNCEEIAIENKMALYEKHSGNKMTVDEFNNAKVKCIHCDNEYLLNEFKVILEKPTGDEYIVCKHYPECDGTMIDFM
jgi:ssDNA-binding Zn-finger/Zn-ribbon topoisomerase 1